MPEKPFQERYLEEIANGMLRFCRFLLDDATIGSDKQIKDGLDAIFPR